MIMGPARNEAKQGATEWCNTACWRSLSNTLACMEGMSELGIPDYSR